MQRNSHPTAGNNQTLLAKPEMSLPDRFSTHDNGPEIYIEGYIGIYLQDA